MIVWTGWGILALPLATFSILGVSFLVNLLAGDPNFFKHNFGVRAAAGLVATVLVWYVGTALNGQKEQRGRIDPNTGEFLQMQRGSRHTVFFIPMEYWGLIIGMIMFFVG